MKSKLFKWFSVSVGLLSLVAFLVPAQAASAQGYVKAKNKLESVLNTPLGTTQYIPPAASPGISVAAPTAFGANWGVVYAGAAASDGTKSTRQADGSTAVGMGFGNSAKYVGVDATLNATSIDRFGHDGNVSLKIHRDLPGMASIAIGALNLLPRDGQTVNPYTYYAAASKVFLLRPTHLSNLMPLFVTVGIGNGVLRRVKYDGDHKDHKGAYNPFAAVAWHFMPQMGVSLDYTAESFNVGFSVVPVRSWPVSVTLSEGDITCRKGRMITTLMVGYIYHFA